MAYTFTINANDTQEAALSWILGIRNAPIVAENEARMARNARKEAAYEAAVAAHVEGEPEPEAPVFEEILSLVTLAQLVTAWAQGVLNDYVRQKEEVEEKAVVEAMADPTKRAAILAAAD